MSEPISKSSRYVPTHDRHTSANVTADVTYAVQRNSARRFWTPIHQSSSHSVSFSTPSPKSRWGNGSSGTLV
jgi:hypothetical protein